MLASLGAFLGALSSLGYFEALWGSVGHIFGLSGTILACLGSLFGSAWACLLYTSPSPRDRQKSRMPSSA